MNFFDYIENHKIVTIVVVLWLLTIVTWVTFMVFSPTPPDIPGTTVSALGIVFGLPALAVGLLKWRGEIITLNRKEKKDE